MASSIQKKVAADIERHGWHVIKVMADEEGPAFAYSIGLTKTLKHPEIIVVGLGLDVMHGMINTAGKMIRDGQPFKAKRSYRGLLAGDYECSFRTVHASRYDEWVGQAQVFYDGDDFELLQCVWPDREGRFPWEPKVHGGFVGAQPILDGPDVPWPFREERATEVFTSRQVLEDRLPILEVSHDDDGDWQFLCGTTDDEDDARMISLAHALALDPSIGELADLPPGKSARRKRAGARWIRD
jgi:hypothetical protein